MKFRGSRRHHECIVFVIVFSTFAKISLGDCQEFFCYDYCFCPTFNMASQTLNDLYSHLVGQNPSLYRLYASLSIILTRIIHDDSPSYIVTFRRVHIAKQFEQ